MPPNRAALLSLGAATTLLLAPGVVARSDTQYLPGCSMGDSDGCRRIQVRHADRDGAEWSVAATQQGVEQECWTYQVGYGERCVFWTRRDAAVRIEVTMGSDLGSSAKSDSADRTVAPGGADLYFQAYYRERKDLTRLVED